MLRAWQRAEGLAGYPRRRGACCRGRFGAMRGLPGSRLLTFLRAHLARLVDVV